MCALLVVSSCTESPTRTTTPAPADADLESEWDPEPGTISSLAPPSIDETTRPTVAPVNDRGLIAASGPRGLRFLRPDGGEVAELAGGLVVSQPTWSRDGRRLAATLIDPDSETPGVAVVDISTWDVAASPANRQYFFYSWSHDGTRLAALGPGPSGGTSLDILDASGALASDTSIESSSIFVAWEPGGRRLLVHAGSQLWLIGDPDSPRQHTNYGEVGLGFSAPAWVPGTQDFLYVDSTGQSSGTDSQDDPAPEPAIAGAGPRLVRRSADGGGSADLGGAEGLIVMSVHPRGGLAALSTLATSPASTDPTGITDPASGTQRAGLQASEDLYTGAVSIIDLNTGERFSVLDSVGFWLEWSHDGRRLLIASPTTADADATTLAWHIWDGQETVELTRFTPTVAFVRDYLRFADQYVETPRLWSPDNEAIVFGASFVGVDTAAVARLDGVGGVRSLGVADVSFWSPAAVDSSSEGPR